MRLSTNRTRELFLLCTRSRQNHITWKAVKGYVKQVPDEHDMPGHLDLAKIPRSQNLSDVMRLFIVKIWKEADPGLVEGGRSNEEYWTEEVHNNFWLENHKVVALLDVIS